MEAWKAVLDAAFEKDYIKDREPGGIPGLVDYEKRLLDAMKGELPEQMKTAGPRQLTFPIIRNLFVFVFIKGFEAGCYKKPPDDQSDEIQLKDMLYGSVKVDLTREMADFVNSRPIPDHLFFAFQNWAFENKDQIDSGKADLENELFKSLGWVLRVGASVGEEFVG